MAVTNDTQHCSHFGRCGGCSLLDVPIATQLANKQARAAALLAEHLDGRAPEISLPPRPPRHDRISILYPVQPRGRGKALGIYRAGTHQVEAIHDCRIQHKALTRFGVRAGEVLARSPVPAYDETNGTGVLRAVRARVMPGTGELLVGAVATTSRFAHRDALIAALADAASDLRDDQGRPLQLVGTLLNVNERPGNALLGDKTIALFGQPWQHDRVGDLALRVHFESFYQQHRHTEAVLFRPALELLGDVAGLHIVDGYGGVGTFALRLLRAGAAHVTLIESAPTAAADARWNLAENGFDERSEVRAQPFGQSPLPACDLVVADPPRKGLGADGADAILAAAPPRVLLVSCALEALQRDLDALATAYRVTALRLCDLFPHTEHIEALTLLERLG